MAVTLTDWLSSRTPAQLAGLLTARPDATAPPAPGNLADLADRLAMPGSIAAALYQLPQPTIELVEVLQLLGPAAGNRADLASWLGCDPTAAALTDSLRLLCDQALVWPDGERLRMVEPLYRTFRYPLGLGEPAKVLLARCSVEQLRSIAYQLSVPSHGRKADLVATIEAVFADRRQVQKLVAQADPPTRSRLQALAVNGPTTDQFADWYTYQQVEPALRWAAARGLILTDEWGVPQPPREVGLALRGADWHAPFHPDQPTLPLTETAAATVEQEAAAAGVSAVDQLTSLLAMVESQPASMLKSGGVGVRELRRLARATGIDEPAVRLWLEVAYEAELLAIQRDRSGAVRLLPTSRYDEWLEAAPADQLAALLPVWLDLPASPLLVDDEPTKPAAPVLVRDHFGQLAATVRRRLLETIHSLPPDRAVVGAADLPAVVRWRSPLQIGLSATTDQLVAAAWREAQLVAVVAHGAVTPLGRALADLDRVDPDRARAELVDACRALLPVATTDVVFQADLTAVVPGSPERALTELLDTAADRESGGGAVTWRFTPGSVRRALDTGWHAEHLAAALCERAIGGTLPQPLTYLLTDVARRHGQIRARTASCVLRADDPALIAELASARGLRSLGLSAISPTVLTSEVPLEATLTALRAAGYAPVAESADGVPQLSRPPRPRAARSNRHCRRTTPTAPTLGTGAAATTLPDGPVGDPVAIAEKLLAAPVPVRPPAPRDPDEPTGWEPARELALSDRSGLSSDPDPPLDLPAALAEWADQLAPGEQQLLAHAIETGQPVTIGYTNARGTRTLRVIDSIELVGEHLIAWCQLRDDERMFSLHRIATVTPAPDAS